MEYAELVHRCFRCGYCKFTEDYGELNCPSYRKYRFESYSPGGRMWLISAWLNHQIKWTEDLANVMYSCTTCNNCVEHCIMKFKDHLVEVIIGAREEMVELGRVPPVVRDTLKNLQVYGTPYKELPEKREQWAEGQDIARYAGEEHLLFIGSVGSFDERGQRMAQALAAVLRKGGVSFGILGQEEKSDGNEAKTLGERALFQSLAEQNIELFHRKGVRSLVALSPHAYDVFKNEYPKYGGDFTHSHYTGLLWNLLREKRLKLGQLSYKVAYHDPCYLGRHNGEYAVPRRVLQAIPGLELLEMSRTKKDAFCCGGGGGNFYTDILGGGEESPAVLRVQEALATGAEVLAVACPNCARMFEDAVKDLEVSDKLRILDIAELVKEASEA